METAISKLKRAIWTIIKILTVNNDSEGPIFPRRVINKWPAIMLADSRIAKVPGRIILLILSIHTINGIKIGGVPWGTKWANISIVLLIQPYNINDSHNGRANLKVIAMCLVLVKIYGNKPIKLLIIIKKNILIKIKVDPWDLLFWINVFISLWIIIINLKYNILNREGINQKEYGIKSKMINDLVQFKENMIVEGSKEENKFVIIFKM